MKEHEYEKLLNIKTSGEQKELNDSFHYNIYEPTTYSALNTLFSHYSIDENDSIVDFGCGKGRLNFYINFYFKAQVTGIEMNNYYYDIALDNKSSYIKEHNKDAERITFICALAENYKIKSIDNKFYFFNPFSLQIFIKVLGNILNSVEDYYRPIDIILFYPSEDFIDYLENYTSFQLLTEIKLREKFINDINQRFLIYRLDYNQY